jgi:nicotinamidase-related amidase
MTGAVRDGRSGAALLVVDMQRYFCEPDWALGRYLVAAGVPGVDAYFARLAEVVIPNIARLIGAWRVAKAPVIFTEFGSRTPDGSDLPPWARRPNELSLAAIGEPIFPPLSDESARVIAALEPSKQDLVVTKTSSGPLAGTDIHLQLRDRLHVGLAVVTGVATDVCVTGFGRELADAGFDVVVVGDGCATSNPDRHEAALQILGTFASVRDTVDVLGSVAPGLRATA